MVGGVSQKDGAVVSRIIAFMRRERSSNADCERRERVG